MKMLAGCDMAGKETGANALELRIENKKAGMVIGKGGEQIKVPILTLIRR